MIRFSWSYVRGGVLTVLSLIGGVMVGATLVSAVTTISTAITTAGNITTSAGDITATAGALTSGTTATVGTSLTVGTTATVGTNLSVVGTASTTNLKVGVIGTSLSDVVVGYCSFSNVTSFTASTTKYVDCTTSATISTSDRVFVQATSSLDTAFVIEAASSTSDSNINLRVLNTGLDGNADETLGGTSINFLAIH